MSDQVPSFLTENVKEDQEEGKIDVLARLSKYVTALDIYNEGIVKLQAELKEFQDAANEISLHKIPDLLNKYGLSEIKLSDGRKVVIKQGISTKIIDERAFFDWLAEHKEDDIVKLHVAFAKMSHEMREDLRVFLNGYNYDYEMQEGVHAATLKSYVTKKLGIGANDQEAGIAEGRYLRTEDFEDMLSIFTYFYTKIDEPKKGKEL